MTFSSSFSAHLPSQPGAKTLRLSLLDLPPHRAAAIVALENPPDGDAAPGLLQRLAELGFMAGETVSVLRRGPGGREPIAVQVGDTVFALRRYEAGCIRVEVPA